jgi:8-oxo-dGTP pyrophosphatase MutT (NUDIX family)
MGVRQPAEHAGPAMLAGGGGDESNLAGANERAARVAAPVALDTGAVAMVRASVTEPPRVDLPPGRGGGQVIPRPPGWQPGSQPPWARLPQDRRRLSVDDVLDALATSPGPRRSTAAPGSRASAVLAALYDDGGEAHVVLTRRAQHLRAHRGEVSFPGGRQDPGEDLRTTALREAWEEVGLEPTRVEVVGELDHLQTVVGPSFIVPWVGVVDGRPKLVPNPQEVERIIHVPLSELLADGIYHTERWGVPPAERELAFFDLVGDTVWGATAAMLRNLLVVATGARA